MCDNQVDYEYIIDREGKGPEELAKIVFSHPPSTINKIVLTNEESDLEVTFQTLLTFLMEGLNIIFPDLYKTSIDDLDLSAVLDGIEKASEWIKMTGYDLYAIRYRREEFLDDHYCRVLLRNSRDKAWFMLRRIYDKDYTFIGGNPDIERSSLSDYKCALKIDDDIITISFALI